MLESKSRWTTDGGKQTLEVAWSRIASYFSSNGKFNETAGQRARAIKACLDDCLSVWLSDCLAGSPLSMVMLAIVGDSRGARPRQSEQKEVKILSCMSWLPVCMQGPEFARGKDTTCAAWPLHCQRASGGLGRGSSPGAWAYVLTSRVARIPRYVMGALWLADRAWPNRIRRQRYARYSRYSLAQQQCKRRLFRSFSLQLRAEQTQQEGNIGRVIAYGTPADLTDMAVTRSRH